jgi:hypothetical protein
MDRALLNVIVLAAIAIAATFVFVDLRRAATRRSLKHLAAAASTFVIWRWMRRQPIACETALPGSGVMSSPIRDTTT